MRAQGHSTQGRPAARAQPMPAKPPLPDNCSTMEEVRAGVDALDAELVTLLARRFGYMRAAARIKQTRGEVRDEARKAEVIAAVRSQARDLGIPDEFIAKWWNQLVEESIAYESDEWDRQRG